MTHIFYNVDLWVTLIHYPKYNISPSNSLQDIKQNRWTIKYRSLTYIYLIRSWQFACLVVNSITVNSFASLFNCIPVGWASASVMAPDIKLYFSWLGSELFCLLLGPPGFNCWFSFPPVFQWCCSTPQGSPGVGRNTLFLLNSQLFFIIVFICDLFVSRDDPLMS